MHMFQHFWTCFDMFQLPRHHIFVLESNANIPSVQEKQAKKAVEVEKARRTDSFVVCPPSCNGMRACIWYVYIYIYIHIYIYTYTYMMYIYMYMYVVVKSWITRYAEKRGMVINPLHSLFFGFPCHGRAMAAVGECSQWTHCCASPTYLQNGETSKGSTSRYFL